MSVEIWVAIITGLLSLIGVIVTVKSGEKKNAKLSQEQTQLTLYRIGELEKKQDKYNHLQERTCNMEQDIAVIKEDLKVVNHRIRDLENQK